MNIVIAGYGPVGQAIFSTLDQRRGFNVWIDDPYKDGKFLDLKVIPKTFTVDAVIICVSTPELSDGRCDTSNVSAVLDKYNRLNPDTKFLIKSAVDPVWLSKNHEVGVIASDGSIWENESPCNAVVEYIRYNMTYSPEFLGGSNMNRDTEDEFKNQTFAIYGGDDCRFWDELFRPSLPKLNEVRYTTLEQAAFSKYVENSFLATKVTFFNEMYQIYNALGFEGFDTMVDAITLDPRIGKSHTQIPGPSGEFGFGGHCLPKDVNALRYVASEAGADTPLLDAIVSANIINRQS